MHDLLTGTEYESPRSLSASVEIFGRSVCFYSRGAVRPSTLEVVSMRVSLVVRKDLHLDRVPMGRFDPKRPFPLTVNPGSLGSSPGWGAVWVQIHARDSGARAIFEQR